MPRKPIKKDLVNTRLLKDYASWIYCTGCEKTVAYLCYVTYDSFSFDYECSCGGKGRVQIEFEHEPMKRTDKELVTIKNRLCCPDDKSPLVTFVDKNLKRYSYSIGCQACRTCYAAAPQICRERASAEPEGPCL